MSDPCWHDITEKDMVLPFTYYWVGHFPSNKIYKTVVTELRPQGKGWATKVSEGLDFDLEVVDGKVVVPFSIGNDRIFNNWWAAYVHMLKLKAGDAIK